MTIVARTVSSNPNGKFHWTVDSFYRAIAGGVFDQPNQLELLQGEIWRKEPMNPPHALLIEGMTALFRDRLTSRFWIREEKPFHIANDGEPVPDVAVVAESARHDRTRHPSPAEMCLVVEVADSSVDRDTGEKALLYAQAGIADYWVSLIPTRELIVFRVPTGDGYLEVARLASGDLIRPLCAPDVEFYVHDLIAPPTISGIADL